MTTVRWARSGRKVRRSALARGTAGRGGGEGDTLPAPPPCADVDVDAAAEASDNAPSVIVVGAGVAGLTAAHELASRGFKVTVVERVRDGRGDPGGPAVGGLARSQYAWFLRTGGASTAMLYKLDDAEEPWGSCDDVVKQTVNSDKIVTSIKDINRPSPQCGDDDVARTTGAARLRGLWEPADSRGPPGSFVRPRYTIPLARTNIAWGADGVHEVFLHWPKDLLARLRSAGAYMGWLAPGRAWSPQLFELRLIVRSGLPPIPYRATVVEALEGELREALYAQLKQLEYPPEDHALILGFVQKARVLFQDVNKEQNGALDADSSQVAEGLVELNLPDNLGECSGKVQECAGEHGYRFFPSFYAHLFDTMKRTPLLERESEEDTPGHFEVRRTAYDNLVSLTHFLFGRDDGQPPDVVSKDTPTSLSAAFRSQRLLLGRLGFETRDLLRLQLRQLAYLTSSRARRAAYADVTWAQFLRLGDGGYSPAFVDAMQKWPQVLVGLQAEKADAKTFGDVAMQQMLEAVRKAPMVDATLNGPTSSAWLDPWRRYLERALCVKFRCGEAQRLYFDRPVSNDGPVGVRVHFADGLEYEDATASSKVWLPYQTGNVPVGSNKDLRKGAYLVLAVPPNEAYRLLRTLEESGRLATANPSDAWTAPLLGELNQSKARGWMGGTFRVLDGVHPKSFAPYKVQTQAEVDDSPLQNFVGLQFFFIDRDIPFVRGHLFLPDHPFAISAISQQQFRVVRGSSRWVAGTLSLDLGDPSGLVNIPGPESPTCCVANPPCQPGCCVADPPCPSAPCPNPAAPPPRCCVADTPCAPGDCVAFVPCQLKVCVGPAPLRPPPAGRSRLWDLSRRQIADECWDHLVTTLQIPFSGDGSDKSAGVLYHIDEGYRFSCITSCDAPPWYKPSPSDADLYGSPWFVPTDLESGDGTIDMDATGIKFNNTPYLVVRAGAFERWPGTLDPDQPQRGYDVEFGNLVCCGTHCQTFTRIGTMESANESARHAANGLLRDFDRPQGSWWDRRQAPGMVASPEEFLGVTSTLAEQGGGGSAAAAGVESAYVPVWTLEEREPEDLALFKAVDEALLKEGLPHLFDVLKLDDLVQTLLPTGNDRPGEPNLIDDVLRLMEGGQVNFQHLSRWASPFVLSMLGALLKVPGRPR